MSDHVDRRPNEGWNEYVKRLEDARLSAIAEHKEQEADALDKVAGDRVDHEDILGEMYINTRELQVAAKAKRASAAEFRQALRRMEDGRSSGG